jgi:ABC-type nitrate/sulfonate/bicarbonate transport system permease component
VIFSILMIGVVGMILDMLLGLFSKFVQYEE